MNRTDDDRTAAHVVLTTEDEVAGEVDGSTQPNTWEGQAHNNNTLERRHPGFILVYKVDKAVEMAAIVEATRYLSSPGWK